MELRQLQYFASAASHLSFTAAAQELNVVQSAVSQQIAALEREWDVQLFQRTSHGLRLTAEGEVLVREARRLLDQAEIMQDLVKQSGKNYTRVLRLGCHGNLLRERLPRILSAFRQAHPKTRVLMYSHMQHDLLSQLREGQVDCFLGIWQKEYARLDWCERRVVYQDDLYVMLPRSHPLAARETLCQAELSGEPLIMFTGDDRKRYLWEMQAQGVETDLYCYTASQNAMETLVASGYGIAMCLGSARRSHEGIVYRRVTDRPATAVCLIWRKEEAEQIQELLSFFLMAQSE